MASFLVDIDRFFAFLMPPPEYVFGVRSVRDMHRTLVIALGRVGDARYRWAAGQGGQRRSVG